MTNAKKSILGGVTVLSVVGIICKLIGVAFRVPLLYLIGEESVGTYQLVFPTYNLLLTISSAGLPVAVSGMVSAALAKDDPRGAKKIFKSALHLLMAIGLVMTLAMLLSGRFLANSLVHDPQSYLGFLAIAPSVLIVCALSAYRGFMQGQQNMVPTAVSQLIEQVLKVFIALPLAWLGSKISMAHAAAGALLGTSITEAIALIYMMVLVRRKSAAFSALPQAPQESGQTTRQILRRLVMTAIPITLGASIVPLAGFVDSAMIMDRLSRAGFAESKARALYGCYSGCVINLINVPTALALAISMSLVPAISAAMTRGDGESLKKQSTLGLRFSFLIGLPCAIGMSLLAKPILHFVYGGTLSAQNFQTTADLLSVSSLTIILFTVVQSTSGILQGLKKQKIPMYTLMAGVLAKIILNAVLIPIPALNIHGAPIASIVCYTVSMVPNLYYVCKYAKLKFDWQGIVLRPLAATAAMAAAVYAAERFLPDGRVMLILKLLIGIGVFAAAAYCFKAITKDDLNFVKKRR